MPPEDVLKRLYRLSRGEIDANCFIDWPALDQIDLPLDATAPLPLLDGVSASKIQDSSK
jgi:hypothetical protein